MIHTIKAQCRDMFTDVEIHVIEGAKRDTDDEPTIGVWLFDAEDDTDPRKLLISPVEALRLADALRVEAARLGVVDASQPTT